MADKISPGVYTYRELLDRAGVNYDEAVRVETEDGAGRVDVRRVQVSGLGFDDPDQIVVVPKFDGDEFLPEGGHTPIEIRVEGKVAGTLEVDNDRDFRAASDLPDHALVPHVDPEKPGVTKNVLKGDLPY
jgi:hypothetical protein